MSRRLIPLRQTGDTIVEVLIAMAIVSFSLGISYNIAHRSQLSIRNAEERGQMLKLAEQQVERLKEYIAENPGTTFPTGGFCIITSGVAHTDLLLKTPLSSPTSPECAVDQYGSFDYDDGIPDSSRDINYPYEAGMVCINLCAGNEFDVFAGRYSLSDNGINIQGFQVVNLQYRVYP